MGGTTSTCNTSLTFYGWRIGADCRDYDLPYKDALERDITELF